MQLKTKVIGAAGIAALVAAGGFAFTASNTVPDTLGYGYGTTTVNGDIVTTDMTLVPASGNPDNLGTVTYTTATNLATAGLQAFISVDDGDLSNACTASGSGPYTLTCTPNGTHSLSSVNKVALTTKKAADYH